MIKHFIKLSLFVLAFLFTMNAFAQSSAIAKVVWFNGSFTANGRALQKAAPIYQNDVLKTGNQSQAQIVFSDNSLMTLKANTNFSVSSYQFKKSSATGTFVGNLVTGGFRTITGMIAKHDPEDYEIKTPVATLGVRGTDYQAVLSNGALYVQVYRGRVCLNNGAAGASSPNFNNWMREPAVYIPQVLAITEERITQPGCPDGGAPSLLENIEDNTTVGGIGSFSVTPFFSGSNLTYSLDSITPALDPGNTVTVSADGTVAYNTSSTPAQYVITVRATNSCGSVVSNAFSVGSSTA